MPFTFQQLAIPGLILIKARRFRDDRGFFLETYKQSAFAAQGIDVSFVQDNYSHSVHRVLRGLHYQKLPQAQGKLVQVLRGEVFDVAVDIRVGSPTYGQWAGMHLSGERFQLLYIPVGFAHGFCVLSDEADFLYKVSADYAPELDAGIVWNDPDIGVEWPIADPIVSPKDARLPSLREAEVSFTYGPAAHEKDRGIASSI
jgi:dTDP-4-dehydrorhamnose 3,5-epimerase